MKPALSRNERNGFQVEAIDDESLAMSYADESGLLLIVVCFAKDTWNVKFPEIASALGQCEMVLNSEEGRFCDDEPQPMEIGGSGEEILATFKRPGIIIVKADPSGLT